MAFIRPEVKEAFWRFRDAFIGIALSVFGLGWAISSVGFMAVLGYGVTALGALLIFTGIERGRFMTGPDGAGVVSVDEGQLTYFGPLEGGSVHVDDLIQVDLRPVARGRGAEWLLLARDAEPLSIPTSAVGADKLFDVFTKLRGMRTGRMLDALASGPTQQVVIWRANAPAVD